MLPATYLEEYIEGQPLPEGMNKFLNHGILTGCLRLLVGTLSIILTLCLIT